MTRRRRDLTRPRLECLGERLLLSTLTPAQVDSAYGLNSVTFSGGAIKGDGAGQTIAIIDTYHDPSIYGDLWAFDARNNLPNPVLTASLPASGLYPNGQSGFSMVNFFGSATNPTWNAEEAADVELAHAAAPRASIVLVEAKSAGVFDLINAIQAVKTLPGDSVISMSWGGPEFDGQQQFDSVFTTPAGHRGITYLAATGDDGAGTQWPASSPNVVAVGGTSLTVNTSGARAAETAWAGSGGGTSPFVSRPTYQAGVVAGTMRSTPDVSAVANPSTGVVINDWSSLMQLGGTSMSTPIWAGLIAVADEGLAVAGKPTLDGATQTLPDLYKAPKGSFFAVSSGGLATPGYNTVTGLGTPNAATLIPFLDGSGLVTVKSGSATSTTAIPSTTAALHPNLAVASTGASPAPAGLGSAGSSIWSPSAVVANLVSVPLPTVPTDPAAVDDVLEHWEPAGTSSPTARDKPRG